MYFDPWQVPAVLGDARAATARTAAEVEIILNMVTFLVFFNSFEICFLRDGNAENVLARKFVQNVQWIIRLAERKAREKTAESGKILTGVISLFKEGAYEKDPYLGFPAEIPDRTGSCPGWSRLEASKQASFL